MTDSVYIITSCFFPSSSFFNEVSYCSNFRCFLNGFVGIVEKLLYLGPAAANITGSSFFCFNCSKNSFCCLNSVLISIVFSKILIIFWLSVKLQLNIITYLIVIIVTVVLCSCLSNKITINIDK